jgi:hypothetical protein
MSKFCESESKSKPDPDREKNGSEGIPRDTQSRAGLAKDISQRCGNECSTAESIKSTPASLQSDAGSCIYPELGWMVHTMPEGRKSRNVLAAGFERSSYTTTII